jgi:hypothetical protein
MLLSAMSLFARRRRSRPGPRGAERCIVSLLLGFVATFGPTGCGHPATEQECQLIVDRIVELELKAQKVTDPNEVAKRRRTILGTVDGSASPDVQRDCVGRHLTERAMACVRSAQTAADISERCLR